MRVSLCSGAQSCPTLSAPWTPLSMEFLEEYWSKSPFLSRDLLAQGSGPSLVSSTSLHFVQAGSYNYLGNANTIHSINIYLE